MGGGGKGQVAPEIAKPVSTVTDIGSQLQSEEQTYDEGQDEERRGAVDKVKMGTRGLRIKSPLVSTQSTPKTVGNTGVSL